MKEPNIIRAGRAASRFGGALLLCGKIWFIGTMGNNIVEFGYEHEQSIQAGEIEDAIISQNFEQAESLLAVYELEPRHSVQLERLLGEQRVIHSIEQALNGGAYQTAQEVLENASAVLHESTAHRYAQRIHDISPEGLVERIRQSSVDKSELCQQYLEWHPNGEHRTEVLSEYITHELNSFAELLLSTHRIGYVQDRATELTDLLRQHSNEEVILPGYLRDVLNDDAISLYASRAYASSDKDLEEGDLMMVDYGFIENTSILFISEHTAFLPGQIGEVSNISNYSEPSIEIEFSTGFFTSETAEYDPAFMTPIRKATQFETLQFQNSVNGIQRMLSLYY